MNRERGGFIGGNWKNVSMTLGKTERWAREFSGQDLKTITKPNLQFVLFPSMNAASELRGLLGKLPSTRALIESGAFLLGGQDISHVVGERDRFTGSIHPRLLKDLGMTHVLVGHSERRINGWETDEIIAKKLSAAIKHDLSPVLCVGETLEEREAGSTRDIVARQLSVLEALPDERRRKLTVAYEPVWAIGTGETASPEKANDMCKFVRGEGKVGQVIYGGSVTSDNAKDFFIQPDIDGALPGGASESAENFYGIARAAADRL